MTHKYKIQVTETEDNIVIHVPKYDVSNLVVALVRAVNTWQDPPESIRKLKNDLLDRARELNRHIDSHQNLNQ